MAKFAKLPIPMTGKEILLGFGYAVIDLFFLPNILNAMNGQLIHPLSGAWLNFLYFSLNFVFLFAIFSRFLKRSLAYCGKHLGDFLLAALAGFSGYWLCNVALSFIILIFFPNFTNPNDGSIADMASGNFMIMAVGAVVLVPAAEELIHRGLIFGTLAKKSRFWGYVVSAAFFAVIHVIGYLGDCSYENLVLAFIQYLPAGIVLGWAYEKSGTIFAPIVIHMVFNAMGIYAMR